MGYSGVSWFTILWVRADFYLKVLGHYDIIEVLKIPEWLGMDLVLVMNVAYW